MSVIELVSSAAILSVSVLMLIGAFFAAANIVQRTEDMNLCKNITETVFEEVRSCGVAAFCEENHINAISDSRFAGEAEYCSRTILLEFEKTDDKALYECELSINTGTEQEPKINTFNFLCVE